MTICPGGLTQPKPGVPAVVAYASSGAGILSVIPKLAKLGPLAYLLSGVSYAISDLCASEPPAMPTLTLAEVNALLQNSLFSSDYQSGLGKLKDMLRNVAWYDLCECQTGGPQTLPTPPTQPDPPAITPTSIPNTTSICRTEGPTTTTWNQQVSGWANANLARFDLVTNPVGVHVRLTVAPHPGGPGSTSHFHVDYCNGPGSYKRVDNFTLGVTDVYDKNFAYDPVWPLLYISGDIDTYNATGEDITNLHEITCKGSAAVGPAACCPPDPLLVSQIASILSTVTLLQRQIAPFGYVPGTVHSGLSGSGTIAVSGLLGYKAQVTTDNPKLGSAGISPGILFDRGYITWGTLDGYPQSERLERASQLSLPARCSAFTEIAYDLRPGIVMTLTELLHEP